MIVLRFSKLLINNRAYVDAKNNYGKTILHLASVFGDLEMIKQLLSEKNGAGLHTQDDFGKTALHRAYENGHLEVVQFLLSRGANISTKTKQGSTPLQKLHRNEII